MVRSFALYIECFSMEIVMSQSRYILNPLAAGGTNVSTRAVLEGHIYIVTIFKIYANLSTLMYLLQEKGWWLNSVIFFLQWLPNVTVIFFLRPPVVLSIGKVWQFNVKCRLTVFYMTLYIKHVKWSHCWACTCDVTDVDLPYFLVNKMKYYRQ